MTTSSKRNLLVAIVVRLMVLAIAAIAVPWTRKQVEAQSGAWSRGLRALPYLWTPPVVGEINPRTPGDPEVPILCPENITNWRWDYDLPHMVPHAPKVGFSVSSGLLWVFDGTRRGWLHFTPNPHQSEDPKSAEYFCTYPLADSTWLIVSTAGRHIHLDADYRRLDEPPAIRRVLSHFGKHPVAGTCSLVLLAMGAWLVFRKWQVTRATFVGLALAALWLWPLTKFLAGLQWTP